MKFECVASNKDYVPVGLIIEGEAVSPLEFKLPNLLRAFLQHSVKVLSFL